MTILNRSGSQLRYPGRISRFIGFPEGLAVDKDRSLPEMGPRILFFSGGTALRSLSRELVTFTHNSIHLITTFDSGGSSATLRKAFHMPAVGDIRNRLMALADRSCSGNPGVFDLFTTRFPKNESNAALRKQLATMAEGHHEYLFHIPDHIGNCICQHLKNFIQNMPVDFDLRGANIGNLILTGGYLANQWKLGPVIDIFSRLANVRGVVQPIVDRDLHLAFELEDGRRIIGQHRVTGKEELPLTCSIRSMALSETDDRWQLAQPSIGEGITRLIDSAALICYPMGSFYSSVLANLLPEGVGRAVAKASCPKVFIPNSGHDPEALGLTVMGQIDRLLSVLKKDAHVNDTSRLLNVVIVDSQNAQYPGRVDKHYLENLGITLIDTRLVSSRTAPYFDPKKLVPLLLKLC